jgi:O-succinylbenzoate synthase
MASPPYGEELDRECLLVSVCAEDLDGWGKCVASRGLGFSYETVETAWHVLRNFFIPAILHRPISHLRDLNRIYKLIKGIHTLVLGLKWHRRTYPSKLDGKCLRELFRGEKHSVTVCAPVRIQENPKAMSRRRESNCSLGMAGSRLNPAQTYRSHKQSGIVTPISISRATRMRRMR